MSHYKSNYNKQKQLASMKKTFVSLTLMTVMSVMMSGLFAQPTGYYNGTENKSGDALKSALNDVISGHTVYSYFYSKEIFKLSDADPNTPGNIIQIYTGKSWPNNDYGSGNDQLNREHIWAKSHGNFGDWQPMDGDVHNLKPVDASVNNDKSNLDYDNGGTPHPEAIGCFFSENNWEPRDQDKGDVARIIFYMDTRYEGENGEIDLTVVDELNTYPEPKHGKLSTLLLWNQMDPPDEFERNRNNVIYSFQRNRNPFIDNPQFAGLIWGNITLSSVSIGNVHQSPEIPVAGQPVTITSTITSSAGAITNATLAYGTSWSNLNQNVTMQGSGNAYSAVIPAQSQGTTVYFKITAQNNTDNASTVIYNFYVPKTFTGTLTSIYDIQGQGPVSPYLDQVVSVSGIVTGNYGANYFLQDGSGAWNGLFIYDQGRNPSIGDSIIVTGTIAEYYEKTELKSITDYYFISGNHPLPAPAVITCSQAGEAYEGVLIRVNNATCTDDNYMANYYMWTVNDGTGDLLVHNTSVFEYEPSEGQAYNVSGPLDYDFDEWKIQLRLGTDVTTGGDVSAPSVLSVVVLNDSTLKVTFSEPVSTASGENISNYSVNNGVTVIKARLHEFVKSELYLTVSKLTGGSYNLTIQSVADLNGNIMPSPAVLPFSTSFGMDEALSFSCKIYPNPAHGSFRVEFPDNIKMPVSVTIFSVDGREVYSDRWNCNGRSSSTIAVNDLPEGMYVVELTSDRMISHTKLIIK